MDLEKEDDRMKTIRDSDRMQRMMRLSRHSSRHSRFDTQIRVGRSIG